VSPLFSSLCHCPLGGGRALPNGSFVREHARENLVNVLQLALQVKRPLDLGARHAAGDRGIVENQFVEI
jgi:hypothetical protein